ncbi:hypothetical protein BsWGS_17779 [Bradybaena similaris]
MSAVPPPPPPPPPGFGSGPPPPPPPPGKFSHENALPSLPQINVPRPKSKMKTLQWQKIPVNTVIGKPNIWTIISHLEKTYEMDYEKMDELFSLNHDSGIKRASQNVDGANDHKKKRENMEVNILDGKRSLNVNIFLKQFRMEHEEIVRLLREGRCEKFGAERLRSLLKLLPSQEEIDAFNAYSGHIDKLGNAEKFFFCLMKLPNYRMRIEGLLIMEEFNINMEWIRPSIEAVIQAAKDIQDSQSLKELIYLILISGNYLNSGNYAGNAAGFKLSSLLKLTEIRANKPGMNLLHYVAQEAEEKNPRLLKFPQEMSFLKDAAQVSIETLTADINTIASKVRAITEQIVVAGVDFQQQMAIFLKEANVEVLELEDDLRDIEIIRQELATFFCEDVKAFHLEECFSILRTFCERLQKATEDNVQRRLQEAKTERRRRISTEVRQSPRPDEQHMNKNNEEHDDSVVDLLLADVRSGYASRKFNDGNFSITKVTKVNLNSPDISAVSPGTESLGDGTNLAPFQRGSYSRLSQQSNRTNSSADGPSPTPDSLAQTRTRRSYSSNSSKDDESLIDYLMDTSESMAGAIKPETQFERYASLRRRRLERKAKQSVLTIPEMQRERTPSPLNTIDPSVYSVKVRNDNSVSQVNNSNESSNSEKLSNSSNKSTIRRTRSLLDRPSSDNANTEQRRKEVKDDLDETDALIKRIKQRLNKKDGLVTSPTAENREEETKNTDRKSSSLDATPLTSKSLRRRTGASASDNNSPLETITEKNSSQDDLTRASQIKPLQRSRERASNRFRSSLDPAEVSKVMQNVDKSSASSPKRSQDDCNPGPSVMVSMRKKISSGMGTDIDGVLKTIEDTGRQIDTVGVTGPMKRTPDSNMKTTTSPPQVAIVAHMTASNIPSVSLNDQDLKVKRDKRKKRSTLSVDDVKAAMKLSNGAKRADSVNNVNDSLKSASSSNSKNSSTTIAKTLPSQAQVHSVGNKNASEKIPIAKAVPTQTHPHSKSDKNGSGNTLTSDDGCNNKERNKAAKLAAARKKFRGQRFGFPGTSDTNASGRARSNVESDSVDQALKEIACQSGMSRSKSYDDHVAKALAGEEDFATNGIMRMNSGSAPDTSTEKCAVMRSSLNRLSMDGRRNGLYIPSDDSDTELKPEDMGTRRSSKSDSTKSFSQLSLKSVNTSTETLPAESESSAEKHTDSLSHTNLSVINSVKSDRSVLNDIPAGVNSISNEFSPLRRSYSLMDKNRNSEEEGDSDNPLAAVTKWKMKRQQRKSVYENVKETDISPANVANSVHSNGHLKSEEGELKNDVGSRNSYASSDRDEGFESASGTMSQRTSMNSNIEVDVYNTPALARRTESHKSKSTVDNVPLNKSVINATKQNDFVISRLSEEADRKERTESWTEQTVRVNKVTHDPKSDISSNDFNNILSPDSGHSTSKEDIWCDEVTASPTISNSASKQKISTSPAKKTPASEDAAKLGKPKNVPSYMQPTNSSANRPARNKQLATVKTDTTTLNTAFIRDSPSRTSARDPASTPLFKRDTVRATMKAETAAVSFQRGTLARTSIRGPRSSVGPSSKSLLSPPTTGRARSDSNASISSAASSTSNISTTPVSEATKRRLAVASETGSASSHSTKSSIHPSKPSSSTIPVSRSTPTSVKSISPASHNKPASSPAPTSAFSRTQSMRVPSGRSSLGHDLKQNTPSTVRRSVTPTMDTNLNTNLNTTRSSLPERPQSTIPFALEGKPARKSSFMSPTATSKAKVDEQTPVAPPRTKSSVNNNKLNILDTPLLLPERPQSAIPFASEGKPARKSSFMSPTAASKAKVDEQTPVAPPRTKSQHVVPSVSPFTRSASLRVPKTASGRKSPAPVELSPHLNLEQHHTLSTVDEQNGREDKVENTLKRSQSFFKRISTVKGKITPSESKTPQKTLNATQ